MKRNSTRRQFLSQAGLAGIGIAAASGFSLPGYAQGSGRTARATLGLVAPRADFDPRLFGAFLEHLGRSIYTGVYDPGNPLSDKRGFRKDVIKEVADLHVPIIRYPGGNMVSGYNWWDGVGPKKDRPTVLERAWNSIETNQFGTNDFMDWAKAVGTEPLLGFNLGTGTSEMAVAYIEYCNYAKGTKWSELRRSHGYDQPHKVKYWCLGNEMDGPWQMGRLTAREYGRKARDIAQQARVIDPDVQLIACGSSNTILPTYLTWDREVLEECYDKVDGISLHNYFGNEPELAGGKSERFLAQNLDMERQIQEITAVADYVQGLYRSPKQLWLSFDEWNVWYRARSAEHLDGKGAVRAQAARGGLQPRGRAAHRRLPEHADAAVGPGARGLPGADRQRHRAAGHQQQGRAAPVHLLPVPDGAQVRARPHAGHPGAGRDLSDPRRGPAPRFRAQCGRALPRRGRDLRCEGEAHRGVRAESRPRHPSASWR